MSFPLSYERAAHPFADEAASSSSPGDLDPEVFRRCGIQLVGGIADYLAHIEEYPVLSTVAPGEILQQVPSCAPEQAEPLEQVVTEALSLLPATTTHWQAPGYWPTSPSPPRFQPCWANCWKQRSTPRVCSGGRLQLPLNWSR